jgi:hypothetical protein
VATIQEFEDAAFVSGRGIGRLIEQPPHLPVALRGARILVHGRTLFAAGTSPDPGRQTGRSRKGGGRRADFGNDLLRRIDAEAGHLGQPRNVVIVRLQQGCSFVVEVAHLRLQQLQIRECHRQEPAIDGMELRARAERVR